MEHWNNGTETTDGIQGNKKFPNKAILNNVGEASVLHLEHWNRRDPLHLESYVLSLFPEKPNEAI